MGLWTSLLENLEQKEEIVGELDVMAHRSGLAGGAYCAPCKT